jgi:2,3-bisphosphoglycerate-independent phosphoglycerate mutase
MRSKANKKAGERSVLLIFLDGLGIGVRCKRRNPVFANPPVFLQNVLDGHLPSLRNRAYTGRAGMFLALDARLGVRGLPQSGTGQTALYTGVNAARLIGQHFGPYVYSTLKPVLERHSIFSQLHDTDPALSVALANAFPQRFFDYLNGTRKRMVAGMYAALTAGIMFRDIEAMKRSEAVSTDITGERWSQIGHPDAPRRSPREAGAVLGRLATANSFTLFEYFLTDKAGHERSMERAILCLSHIDELLRGVYDTIDHSRVLVLVTSDHGNMEEISIKMHTRNPVPLFAFGNRHGFNFSHLSCITDVIPETRRFLSEAPASALH